MQGLEQRVSSIGLDLAATPPTEEEVIINLGTCRVKEENLWRNKSTPKNPVDLIDFTDGDSNDHPYKENVVVRREGELKVQFNNKLYILDCLENKDRFSSWSSPNEYSGFPTPNEMEEVFSYMQDMNEERIDGKNEIEILRNEYKIADENRQKPKVIHNLEGNVIAIRQRTGYGLDEKITLIGPGTDGWEAKQRSYTEQVNSPDNVTVQSTHISSEEAKKCVQLAYNNDPENETDNLQAFWDKAKKDITKKDPKESQRWPEIKEFSLEQGRRLKELGYIIIPIGEDQSISSLSDSGEVIYDKNSVPCLIAVFYRRPMHTEVAFNVDNPFLKEGDGKNFKDKVQRLNLYTNQVKKYVKGVEVIMPEAIDYIALGRKLFNIYGRNPFSLEEDEGHTADENTNLNRPDRHPKYVITATYSFPRSEDYRKEFDFGSWASLPPKEFFCVCQTDTGITKINLSSNPIYASLAPVVIPEQSLKDSQARYILSENEVERMWKARSSKKP